MKTEHTQASSSQSQPGFFKRLLNTFDQRLKAKAEAKAEQGCCCNSDKPKDKDGKCC